MRNFHPISRQFGFVVGSTCSKSTSEDRVDRCEVNWRTEFLDFANIFEISLLKFGGTKIFLTLGYLWKIDIKSINYLSFASYQTCMN